MLAVGAFLIMNRAGPGLVGAANNRGEFRGIGLIAIGTSGEANSGTAQETAASRLVGSRDKPIHNVGD